MELKVNSYKLPAEMTFNYEELKAEITEKANLYANLVFTKEQLPEAKADRAKLNKLKKALNDERLKREREYMQPFNDFKCKINEIIKIIDEPVKAIDGQIKTFEELKKAEKLEKIKEYFNEVNKYEWLTLEKILNEKWLNASTSMKAIQEELDKILRTIKSDLYLLETLPEYSFEAIELYKDILNLELAAERSVYLRELDKKKAEAEKEKKQEKPVKDVKRQWVSFTANLSVNEAKELAQFFKERNIEFKAV